MTVQVGDRVAEKLEIELGRSVDQFDRAANAHQVVEERRTIWCVELEWLAHVDGRNENAVARNPLVSGESQPAPGQVGHGVAMFVDVDTGRDFGAEGAVFAANQS